MPNYLVRGILLGGSLGAIAALTGIAENLPRMVALGMVAGFFAGITLARKHKKKEEKENE